MNNSVFLDVMDHINTLAQSLGYVNGMDWAREAVQAGKIAANDLAELESAHHFRNILAHGGASEITISEGRIVFVKKILSVMEETCSSVGIASRELVSAAKATPEEIEAWFLKAKEYDRNEAYEEAVIWYRKAAEQGDPRAQNNLGICYERGNGVAADLKAAVRWYRQSAEQGNAIAQGNLGLCYELGKGMTKDWAAAVIWYEKAAEQGYPHAQYRLAECYRFGKGRKKDDQAAVKWYEKAAEQGHASARGRLGECYYKGRGVSQNYDRAVYWYLKGAEQGSLMALNGLGDCYRSGNGVNRDLQAASKYYYQAAEQGDPFAQANLARCYQRGEGLPESCSFQQEWYQRAISGFEEKLRNGSPDQYYECAEFLRIEHRDFTRSADWYEKAARQGHVEAMIALGDHMLNIAGSGESGARQARQWYRAAAEKGSAEAMFQMGSSYYRYCYYGNSGEANKIEAGRWFLKAAVWGYTVPENEAHMIRGFLHNNYATPDLVEEMRRASEQGYASAYRYLILCYQEGYGVKKDAREVDRYRQLEAEQSGEEVRGIANATDAGTKEKDKRKQKEKKDEEAKQVLELLLKSAEQGDASSQYEVARCYAKGKGAKKDLKKAFKWYQQAAEQKHTEACFELASCYEQGLGVEADKGKAFQYYLQSQNAQVSYAKKKEMYYCLGYCYANGIGTKVSYPEAKYYYGLAAEGGHEKAKEGLAAIRFKGLFAKRKK